MLLPESPLIAGVAAFDGGFGSYRPSDPNVAPGALRIAEWEDGRTLVAQGTNPRRVDLGMWPGGYDNCANQSDGWNSASDGIRLMANALEVSATGGGPIGASYCGPASINSSGQPGVIAAFGSAHVVHDAVRLEATQLATGHFGMFLVGQTPGSSNPPGSQGTLCLGGAIGRYSKDVQGPGSAGEMALQLDLAHTPTPSGPVAIQPGETWRWQAWFRDKNPGQTSNFTDGVAITFL